MKISSFRRYYRSVRHYAVNKPTADELKLEKDRCANSLFWTVAYNLRSWVFMTEPLIVQHSNMPKEGSAATPAEVTERLESKCHDVLTRLFVRFRQATASDSETVEM